MENNENSQGDLSANIPLDPNKEGLMDIVIAVGKTSNNPNGELIAHNNLRNFEMHAAIVSIPPLWNNSITAGKLIGGNTLLKVIGDSTVQSYDIKTPTASFRVHLNQGKELSAISMSVLAIDLGSAIIEFQSIVNPYLSLLSWKYSIPLSLSNVNGIDAENEYKFSKFIQPFNQKMMTLSVQDTEFTDENLDALYSFNREILNSTNAAYRLLCIHKCFLIIRIIHENVRKKVMSKNLDLKDFKNLTEIKIESNILWADATGWKLNRLVDTKVRSLRNQIAHEIAEDGSFANPDKGIFAQQIRDYGDALIPLMRSQFERIVSYHNNFLK